MDQLVGQPQSSPSSKPKISGLVIVVILAVVVIIAGVAAGLMLKEKAPKTLGQESTKSEANPSGPPLPQQDEKTFRDQAEGTIEKNEVDDPYAQGTHKLIREGGESQAAYLVSSVVDLDQYVGKKVKLFGETNFSEDVGWLMDVGRVEELQ